MMPLPQPARRSCLRRARSVEAGRSRWSLSLLLLVGFLWGLSVQAHQGSDAFVSLTVTQRLAQVRVDLAVRDLDLVFGLDDNVDGKVTWGELKGHEAEIFQYVRTTIQFRLNERPLVPGPMELLVDEHAEAAFAVLRFQTLQAEPVLSAEIHYRCVFEVDALHRAFVKLENEGEVKTGLLSPAEDRLRIEYGKPETVAHGMASFIREGVWHIWTGYDHVLFLLALLLPSVVRRKDGCWRGVDRLRPALWSVLRTVTAFTLAHSITLSMAGLGWIQLSPRLVEPVIAASVMLAAWNNLRPIVLEREWCVAFGFGLIHGFGFAGVLQELDLAGGSLIRPLLGFNLGVELGQAAIVLLFVPAAFALRQSAFYQRGVLGFGSVAILLVAAGWLVQRLVG